MIVNTALKFFANTRSAEEPTACDLPVPRPVDAPAAAYVRKMSTGRIMFVLLIIMISLNALVVIGGRTRIPVAPTLSTSGISAPKVPFGYQHRPTADSFENDMGGAFNASYNYDRFLGRSLRQGIIPLWDPYLGFGMPHLGNGLSAVLYPLNWLHAVVPARLSDIILFLNWWLAAAFLTLFLLRIGLDSISAAAGGLVVLSAGWFAGWLALR